MTKLRILLFAANPTGDLELDEEVRSIEQGLSNGRYRGAADLRMSLAARPRDLITRIEQEQPQVVHFSGHGRGGGAPGGRELLPAGAGADVEAEIILVNDHGSSQPVNLHALGDLFRYQKGDIRLVVLNACSTQRQAEVISRQIDCVIGTNKTISDKAARAFSARFYQSLANGDSVRKAFDVARNAIDLEGLPDAATPELFTRDGVDAAEIVLISPAAEGAGGDVVGDRGNTGPRQPGLADGLLRWASANQRTIALALGGVAVVLASSLGLATALTRATGSQALSYLLLAAPLSAVITLHVIPDYLKRRKDCKLLDQAVFGRLRRPGFFRVHPYGDSPSDRSLYERADQAHVQFRDWLLATDEPFVYLTGSSGTGKSSLLHAYVLPVLREGKPSFHPVLLRNYHDPIESLRRALLEAGSLRSDPEMASADLPTLLDRVARAASGTLLLVFDQFEEFLILSDRDPERLNPFKQFVASLGRSPSRGVRALVSMRSDFLGLLQRHGFPPMQSGENWFAIGAFSSADSQRFLERSGLTIGRGLMGDLIDQLTRIERLGGLIRPITLNMVGLILERRATPGEPNSPVPVDRMLDCYLDDCLHDPDVRFHAPRVIAEMITRFETVRPCTVEALTAATGAEPYVIVGVLLNLANRGLVRRIDQARDVWAVSHDFIAQRLSMRLRPTPFQRARPWVAPALVAAGCLAAAGWTLTRGNNPAPSSDRRESGAGIASSAAAPEGSPPPMAAGSALPFIGPTAEQHALPAQRLMGEGSHDTSEGPAEPASGLIIRGNGGEEFDDTKFIPARARITAVRVRAGISLDLVQFMTSEGEGPRHGGDGGDFHSIELANDEYISEARVTYGNRVDSVKFKIRKKGSNAVRETECFGAESTNTMVITAPEGYEIFGARGRSGSWIDRLDFCFRPLK